MQHPTPHTGQRLDYPIERKSTWILFLAPILHQHRTGIESTTLSKRSWRSVGMNVDSKWCQTPGKGGTASSTKSLTLTQPLLLLWPKSFPEGISARHHELRSESKQHWRGHDTPATDRSQLMNGRRNTSNRSGILTKYSGQKTLQMP